MGLYLEMGRHSERILADRAERIAVVKAAEDARKEKIAAIEAKAVETEKKTIESFRARAKL